MIVLMYIGIILGAIIGIFILEVLIAALYPRVTVTKQYLDKRTHLIDKKSPQSNLREDVNFEADGISISAWLYLPENVSIQVPCIVMGNGLGGTKNMTLDSYAIRFQEAGMAVLSFDYRYTGESEGEPRQLLWIRHQLKDYMAAIEYARGLKEIDPDKIAVWGTSLSGGHALVTAARDSRIACVSVQCPLIDGYEASEQQFQNIGLKHVLRMAGHAQRDLVRSWLGLSPHKIPIVGKPGTIALMADADAWNAFNEMAPDDFINEACARIGIRVDKYRPISQINKIRCPVLLQVCDFDAALPLSVVNKAIKQLGTLGEVVHYPIGHFDIYKGNNFESAVNRQVAFFKSISEHIFIFELEFNV